MDERRSEDLDHLYRALEENTRACARSLEHIEACAHARQGWSWSRFGANAATALLWVASGAVAAWGVWCVVVALFGGVFPLPFVHLEVVEGSILLALIVGFVGVPLVTRAAYMLVGLVLAFTSAAVRSAAGALHRVPLHPATPPPGLRARDGSIVPIMMNEYADFPVGQDGLPEWLAEKARQGYDVGAAIATFDANGRAVLRYPMRRVLPPVRDSDA